MDNQDLKKELFKKILGELIDSKYSQLDEKEILIVANGAVNSFMEKFIK